MTNTAVLHHQYIQDRVRYEFINAEISLRKTRPGLTHPKSQNNYILPDIKACLHFNEYLFYCVIIKFDLYILIY